jgi:hypothetical protein
MRERKFRERKKWGEGNSYGEFANIEKQRGKVSHGEHGGFGVWRMTSALDWRTGYGRVVTVAF